MHRALVLLDLAVMLTATGGAVGGRSRFWGWPLLLAGGLWLPLNNGVLEGPVLVVVDSEHGLTLSDLLGVTAAVAGGLRLWPPHRGRSAGWLAARAAVVVAVVLAGFLTAIVVTTDRVDERERFRYRQPRGPVERASGADLRRAGLAQLCADAEPGRRVEPNPVDHSSPTEPRPWRACPSREP